MSPLLYVVSVSTESILDSLIGEVTLKSATQTHENQRDGTEDMWADHLAVDRSACHLNMECQEDNSLPSGSWKASV